MPSKGCFAIVAYRELIDRKSTGTLDIRVRWFPQTDVDWVRRRIENEPPRQYKNDAQQLVSIELAEIFAVEKLGQYDPGEEVIGFLTDRDELTDIM
jgi:hypothetical protein